MTSRSHHHTDLNCAVMVHGYGFLASVQMFDASLPGCPLRSPQTLNPGDAVQLEIAPKGHGAVTVGQGIVQWVKENEVKVTITLMNAEEKQKLGKLTRSSIQGEASLLRWMWRFLRGHVRHCVYLSFESLAFEETVSLSEAA